MGIKIVVFGLSISSSWGNDHVTLWRGLCRALARHGHRIIFFEHDVPYYAAHRDLVEFPGTTLHLYSDWNEVLPLAPHEGMLFYEGFEWGITGSQWRILATKTAGELGI